MDNAKKERTMAMTFTLYISQAGEIAEVAEVTGKKLSEVVRIAWDAFYLDWLRSQNKKDSKE